MIQGDQEEGNVPGGFSQQGPVLRGAGRDPGSSGPFYGAISHSILLPILAPNNESMGNAGLPSALSSIIDRGESRVGGAGMLGSSQAELRSVLATTSAFASAESSVGSNGCSEEPCFGSSEPVVYLCYFRSKKYTGAQLKKLAEEFCEENSFKDPGQVDFLASEAQLAADAMCKPVNECYCEVTSSGMFAQVEQFLSPADADALAKQLRLPGRNAAKALDPKDTRVPESARVYTRVECYMSVSGKCAPTQKSE